MLLDTLENLCSQELYPTVVNIAAGRYYKQPKLKLSSFLDGQAVQSFTYDAFAGILRKALKEKTKKIPLKKLLDKQTGLALYTVAHSVIDVDAVFYEGKKVSDTKEIKALLLKTPFKPLIEAGFCFPSAGGKGFHIVTLFDFKDCAKHMKLSLFYKGISLTVDLLSNVSDTKNCRYHILSTEAVRFFQNFRVLKADLQKLCDEHKDIKTFIKEFAGEQTSTRSLMQDFEITKEMFNADILHLYTKALNVRGTKPSISEYLELINYFKSFYRETQNFTNQAASFFAKLPHADANIFIHQIKAHATTTIPKEYNLYTHLSKILRCVDTYIPTMTKKEHDVYKATEEKIKKTEQAYTADCTSQVADLLGYKKSSEEIALSERFASVNKQLVELDKMISLMMQDFDFSPLFLKTFGFIKKFGLRTESVKTDYAAFGATVSLLGYLKSTFKYETAYTITTNFYSCFLAGSGGGKQTLSNALRAILKKFEEFGYIEKYENITSKGAFLVDCLPLHKRVKLLVSDEAFGRPEIKNLIFPSEKTDTYTSEVTNILLNLFSADTLDGYTSLSQGNLPEVKDLSLSMQLFGQYKALDSKIDLTKGGFNRMFFVHLPKQLRRTDLLEPPTNSEKNTSNRFLCNDLFDAGSAKEAPKETATDSQMQKEAEELFLALGELLFKDLSGFSSDYPSLSNEAELHLEISQMNLLEFKERFFEFDSSTLSEEQIKKESAKKIDKELLKSFYSKQSKDRKIFNVWKKDNLDAFDRYVSYYYDLLQTSSETPAALRVPFYVNKIFLTLYNDFLTFKDGNTCKDFLKRLNFFCTANLDLAVETIQLKDFCMQDFGSKYLRESNDAFERVETFCLKEKRERRKYMPVSDFMRVSGAKKVIGSAASAAKRNEFLDKLIEEELIVKIDFMTSDNPKAKKPVAHVVFF